MAITQVGSATTDTDTGSTGVITITKPTGVTSGDVLIVTLASNLNGYTVPSGFTQFMISTDVDTPNSFRSYMFYKVCGGSEPADYTFTKSSGGDGAPVIGIMAAFRGVDNSSPILQTSYVGGGAAGEPSNPSTSFTATEMGRVFFCRNARSTTAIPTFSTGTSGWAELGDVGDFSGGSVRYACSMYWQTADVSSGSQVEPAVTCSTTETDNVFFLFSLRTYWPPATPTKANVTATAYNASSLVGSSGAFASIAATAHNASVLTGVAAEATTHAPVTVTAYNAMGWVIHPVDVGVVAFDATVAITTDAEHAAVSVNVPNAIGYYGAPRARVWSIPAEDRTWHIAAESRVYRIPSED